MQHSDCYEKLLNQFAMRATTHKQALGQMKNVRFDRGQEFSCYLSDPIGNQSSYVRFGVMLNKNGHRFLCDRLVVLLLTI